MARSAVRGGTLRSAARPSANGHCETTAAIAGSCAATATTWPPENDVPKSAMRGASIPPRVRAKAIGGAVVGLLAPDVQQLARLAAGVAEVAVVEEQHRDPGGGEALGVGRQACPRGWPLKPWAMTTQGASPARRSGR